jgi:hypothetical protein
MLKYIIPLLIIYFIYIYNKPFFIQNMNSNINNKYINMLIEKNIIIFIISIISSLIIWNNNKEYFIFVFALIFINLIIWIRIIKFNNIEKNNLNTEDFISSVKKPINDAYINEESRKQFEHDFINECYDKKLLTNFKQIISNKEINKKNTESRETTIDLALHSDNMFSIQQKENKCIIANYIPDNLEIISTNTFYNNI